MPSSSYYFFPEAWEQASKGVSFFSFYFDSLISYAWIFPQIFLLSGKNRIGFGFYCSLLRKSEFPLTHLNRITELRRLLNNMHWPDATLRRSLISGHYDIIIRGPLIYWPLKRKEKAQGSFPGIMATNYGTSSLQKELHFEEPFLFWTATAITRSKLFQDNVN